MACGVTKTMVGGEVAVCDNLGSSSHTGLHSGITTKFWFNLEKKVRVYWSALDVTPARQKPIIRGDRFAPLPEGEIPPPEGTSGRLYTVDFTGIPDSPGTTSPDFDQVIGPSTGANAGRILGESVAIPGNLGMGASKITWAYVYKGGDNAGRLNTDKWKVTLRAVPTTRSVASDMSCSILAAVSDVWGTVFECALFSGSTIKFIFNNTVRATATVSAAANRMYSLHRTGNLFELFVDDDPTAVLTWLDSTNMVPSGAANRKWGFSMQANFPFAQRQYDSHGVDWITAEDVT